MSSELSREDVDRLTGAVVLEFGASWCPHCQAIQPALTEMLRQHPQVKHIKIEDGPYKPLGRSFGVKLWPNFVLLHDGQVICQLARPSDEAIAKALADLAK